MYFAQARYYRPDMGRFLTQDTYLGNAWDPKTLHLYAYVGNNPVNFIDPTGHDAVPAGVDFEGYAWEWLQNKLADDPVGLAKAQRNFLRSIGKERGYDREQAESPPEPPRTVEVASLALPSAQEIHYRVVGAMVLALAWLATRSGIVPADIAVSDTDNRPIRIMYRGIEGPVPEPTDFMSFEARGRPNRRNVDPEIWRGISVFDDLQTAKERTAKARSISHFAVLGIRPGVGVLKKTFGPHHYTWWVDPLEAMGTVTGVIPR